MCWTLIRSLWPRAEVRGVGRGRGGVGTQRACRDAQAVPAAVMPPPAACAGQDCPLTTPLALCSPPAGLVENEVPLRTRRALLMEGLAASLRLPEVAVVAAAAPAAGAEAAGDGVFLRLMSLTKGKKLLARALRVIYPAPEATAPRHSALVDGDLAAPAPAQWQRPNLRVVWSTLRNLRALFAGRPGVPDDAAATGAVAAALAEVLRRLHSAEAVADCLAAILVGDLDGAPLMDSQPDAVLLPLYAPGQLGGSCTTDGCSAGAVHPRLHGCADAASLWRPPAPRLPARRRQRARHAAALAGGRAHGAAAARRRA